MSVSSTQFVKVTFLYFCCIIAHVNVSWRIKEYSQLEDLSQMMLSLFSIDLWNGFKPLIVSTVIVLWNGLGGKRSFFIQSVTWDRTSTVILKLNISTFCIHSHCQKDKELENTQKLGKWNKRKRNANKLLFGIWINLTLLLISRISSIWWYGCR